jgi:hypothetical protein
VAVAPPIAAPEINGSPDLSAGGPLIATGWRTGQKRGGPPAPRPIAVRARVSSVPW